MMHGTDGLVIKVKGRERFQILDVRREITGCMIAKIKILPDFILRNNPLLFKCQKNTSFFYESYLHKVQNNNRINNKIICTQAKAEFLNTQSFPAWVYRKYDCSYNIHLIIMELLETFKQKLPFKFDNSCQNSNDSFDYKDPLLFSNWLLKNFPFDDNMRIECLKLNCVNQRLIHMYKLLKSFTNINCQNCRIKLCSKTDVFSISNQGKLK